MFNEWFKVFLEERGIDMSEYLSEDIQIGDLCSYIMSVCPEHEKKRIKQKIVEIDFVNSSVERYLKYLHDSIDIEVLKTFKSTLHFI